MFNLFRCPYRGWFAKDAVMLSIEQRAPKALSPIKESGRKTVVLHGKDEAPFRAL
jgi:hypothetical protein